MIFTKSELIDIKWQTIHIKIQINRQKKKQNVLKCYIYYF